MTGTAVDLTCESMSVCAAVNCYLDSVKMQAEISAEDLWEVIPPA